jgi:hypothetical protein
MAKEFIADPKAVKQCAEAYATALEAEKEATDSVRMIQGQLEQSKEQHDQARERLKKAERELQNAMR